MSLSSFSALPYLWCQAIDFMFDFHMFQILNLFCLGIYPIISPFKRTFAFDYFTVNHQKGVNVSGGPPISLCM